jgi:hypothetical protein
MLDIKECEMEPETFINDFANAIAFLAPLTGGENRPNVVVRNLTENGAVRVVETIFQFAVRASSSA